MQFIWNDLIARARTYVDDDHNDSEGYIAPATWLTFANVEYAQLYRRWVRASLVNPPTVDQTFTGPSVVVTGVLATVGLARTYTDGSFRVLQSSQSMLGRGAFWNPSTPGEAVWWHASGNADTLTYQLEPEDPSNTYVVRYLPTVPYVTDPTTTIDLPYGTDERLVQGMARRSMIKENAASRLLEQHIMESDAELNFMSFARLQGDAPRVRRIQRTQHAALNVWPNDPSRWTWR